MEAIPDNCIGAAGEIGSEEVSIAETAGVRVVEILEQAAFEVVGAAGVVGTGLLAGDRVVAAGGGTWLRPLRRVLETAEVTSEVVGVVKVGVGSVAED